MGVGTQYTSASKISVAHEVCTAYDQGFGDFDMFDAVQKAGGLSRMQSAMFVGAAAAGYCPQYSGYVPGTRTHKL
jgi:hypothetical protein